MTNNHGDRTPPPPLPTTTCWPSWLATVAGERLLEVRARGSRGSRAQGRRRPGRARAADDAARRAPARRRGAVRGGAEKRPTRPATSAAAGSGSSTRSTAPASSPSRRATTGPCTSPSGRTASWSPAPWPSPRSGRRSTPAAAPVVPDRTSERPRIAVSRTRPPAFVEALAEELDAELVPMGSAGVKVISVVRDITDAYVHAGGQYEWDNAAPVAVARCRRPVLLARRRLGAALQPGRRVPARPDRVPSRAVRGDPRLRPAARHRLTTLRVERPRTGPSSRGPRGRACGSAP